MKKLLLALSAVLGLPCCSSTGSLDKQKVSALASLAIDYAVSSGKISPTDAALVYQAKEIVLSQAEPVILEPVEVNSGK